MTKRFDLSCWSLLVCRGKQARPFLQGYLTCDINRLTTEDFLLGAACNQKGRVVASIILIRGATDDEVFLLLPSSTVAGLRSLWDKYLLLYRELSLKEYYGEHRAEDADAKKATSSSFAISTEADNNALLTRALWEDLHINIYSQPDDAPAAPTELAELLSWDSFLVAKSIPFVTEKTAELMTPNMMNYGELDAISYTKGCYLGQEVVARVHYKGKLSRSCQMISCFITDKSEDYHAKQIIMLSDKGTKADKKQEGETISLPDNQDKIEIQKLGDGQAEHDEINYRPICEIKPTEVGQIVNYYIKDSRLHGIALLSNNILKNIPKNIPKNIKGQQLFLADKKTQVEIVS